MIVFERAARIYCKEKGIDPDAVVNWELNARKYAMMFEEFHLKLLCLEQAQDSKTPVLRGKK